MSGSAKNTGETLLLDSLNGLLSVENECELSRRLESDAGLARQLALLAHMECMLQELVPEVMTLGELNDGRASRERRRTILKWVVLPLFAAAALVATWFPAQSGGKRPPIQPVANSTEIDGLIQAYVNAWVRREPARAKELLDTLLSYGNEGPKRVETAISRWLQDRNTTLDEALAKLLEKLAGGLLPAPGEISTARGTGRHFPQEVLDDPGFPIWVLTFLEGELQLHLALRKGEPSLTSSRLAIRSFEEFASRGHWAAAARCLAAGNSGKARKIYDIIISARKRSPGPLRWDVFLWSDGSETNLLVSSVSTIRQRNPDGSFRFSDTFAIARVQQDSTKRFLIEDVIEGDTFALNR